MISNTNYNLLSGTSVTLALAGGVVFENPDVKPLFEDFAISKNYDLEAGTIEDFLIENDDWFEIIFKTNL